MKALMHPDNTDDVYPYNVPIVSKHPDRPLALQRYRANEKNEGTSTTTKAPTNISKKTVNIAEECNVYSFKRDDGIFKRDDPTTCAQVPTVERLASGDLCNYFAARAVDTLIGVAMRGLEYVNMFGQSHLALNLESFHEVSTEPMTINELKGLVREQLTDLAMRCDARIEDLGGRTQFDPKRKMKQMAEEDGYVTQKEEEDYEDAMLCRTPDVLMTRYLSNRVNSRSIGFEANRPLSRAIKVLLAAELLN
jgi:hypothetical protein